MTCLLSPIDVSFSALHSSLCVHISPTNTHPLKIWNSEFTNLLYIRTHPKGSIMTTAFLARTRHHLPSHFSSLTHLYLLLRTSTTFSHPFPAFLFRSRLVPRTKGPHSLTSLIICSLVPQLLHPRSPAYVRYCFACTSMSLLPRANLQAIFVPSHNSGSGFES